MNILGLDVSTNCIGICLLNNSDIVFISYIDVSKLKNLLEKAKYFENFIIDFFKKHDLKEICICIEEPNLAYRPGMSTANTISTLNKFNGMIQYIMSNFGSIETVMATSARKNIGLKILPEKKCGIKTKEQVKNYFENKTSIIFNGKQLKNGPRKDKIIFNEKYYDAIDAWVVALSYYILNNKSNEYTNKHKKD
jgi:hypothetical protein